MADDEKEKPPANQILQALDALSQTLNHARAKRRNTTSLTPPRSARASDDVVDIAEGDVAWPRPRRRLSPASSPLRSRHKVYKSENDEDEEEEDMGEGDDPAKSQQQQGFAAVTPEDVAADGEKKGTMSWGPIRVLSHTGGARRFGCVFSVEVVAAQGLPPSMNGLRLAVNVRKKEARDGGAADHDEALYVRCSLHGTGGGAAGKQPRPPFLLSIAVDAPELVAGPFGRSAAVDLKLFAKDFTEKGQCVRQWDVAFPLAGKAKGGGDVVVKLAFQSIDNRGAGKYSYGQLAAGDDKTLAMSSFARKLRMSSISDMLTSKMAHTREPKLGVPAPDLQGIDSFMLDEDEPVAAEVKEKQQEEPEPGLTPVVEMMHDEEKDPEPEPEDSQDDDSELLEFDVIDKSVQGEEGKAELKEEGDEAKTESEDASVVTGHEVASELETKALEEATPSDASDGVAVAVEPVDAEAARSEEASVVIGDEVATEVANELDTKVLECLEEATLSGVSDVVVDAVEPVDAEAARPEEASLVADDEVANELETKALEEATPSDMPDAIADAMEPEEAEAAGPEEVTAGESLPVPEEGEDKGVAAKPSRGRPRRFGWRILALLVTPVAVHVSRVLATKR